MSGVLFGREHYQADGDRHGDTTDGMPTLTVSLRLRQPSAPAVIHPRDLPTTTQAALGAP